MASSCDGEEEEGSDDDSGYHVVDGGHSARDGAGHMDENSISLGLPVQLVSQLTLQPRCRLLSLLVRSRATMSSRSERSYSRRTSVTDSTTFCSGTATCSADPSWGA